MNTEQTTTPDAVDGALKHNVWRSSGEGRSKSAMQMHRTDQEQLRVVAMTGMPPITQTQTNKRSSVAVHPTKTKMAE